MGMFESYQRYLSATHAWQQQQPIVLALVRSNADPASVYRESCAMFHALINALTIEGKESRK